MEIKRRITILQLVGGVYVVELLKGSDLPACRGFSNLGEMCDSITKELKSDEKGEVSRGQQSKGGEVISMKYLIKCEGKVVAAFVDVDDRNIWLELLKDQFEDCLWETAVKKEK